MNHQQLSSLRVSLISGDSPLTIGANGHDPSTIYVRVTGSRKKKMREAFISRYFRANSDNCKIVMNACHHDIFLLSILQKLEVGIYPCVGKCLQHDFFLKVPNQKFKYSLYSDGVVYTPTAHYIITAHRDYCYHK